MIVFIQITTEMELAAVELAALLLKYTKKIEYLNNFYQIVLSICWIRNLKI